MSTIDVVVARIGKPHGIRGEVTLDLRTDEPERRFAAGATLALQKPTGSAFPHATLTVARTRWHQTRLLATFEELTTRNDAEAARGVMLVASVDPDETPDDPDEYYDHQIVGLAAYDVDGRELGVVTAIAHGGAQDLLTVRTPEGRDGLVPFVKALVPEVDVPGGRLVIADRPGLVTPLEDDA